MGQKYTVGIRFLAEHNLMKGEDVARLDFLVCKVMEEGAEMISAQPQNQYHFSFNPETVTPKGIAHCLRSLAYKIQMIDHPKNGGNCENSIHKNT